MNCEAKFKKDWFAKGKDWAGERREDGACCDDWDMFKFINKYNLRGN